MFGTKQFFAHLVFLGLGCALWPGCEEIEPGEPGEGGGSEKAEAKKERPVEPDPSRPETICTHLAEHDFVEPDGSCLDEKKLMKEELGAEVWTVYANCLLGLTKDGDLKACDDLVRDAIGKGKTEAEPGAAAGAEK